MRKYLFILALSAFLGNADGLKEHSLLVEEAQLDPTVRKWIQKAESLFCPTGKTEKNAAPLLEALANLDENTFPAFIKDYSLDLKTQIELQSKIVESYQKQIEELKAQEDVLNVPAMAKKMGADYKWGYDSLIFFAEKTANQKSPELESFLKNYGIQKKSSSSKTVWRKTGYQAKAFYEYDLDVEKLAKIKSDFMTIQSKLNNLENDYLKNFYALLNLKALDREISPDTKYSNGHLNLKSLNIYFDKNEKTLFVVENPQSKESEKPLSGIEICLDKSNSQAAPTPMYFTFNSKEECEEHYERLADFFSRQAEEALKKLPALNVSKAEIRTGLEEQVKYAEEMLSADESRGLGPYAFALNEDANEKIATLDKLKETPLSSYDVKELIVNSKFQYAFKEGNSGLEVYPLLREVEEGHDATIDNPSFTGKLRFLSTTPVMIIDYKLIDLDEFKKLILYTFQEEELSHLSGYSLKGIPNGYFASNSASEFVDQSAKDILCAQFN